MNQLSLSNYFKQTPNVVLISCAEDSFALMDYLIMQFRRNDATRHKFAADRYFNYAVIKEILNSGSLFNDTTYIEINYKTKPTAEQQKETVALLDQLDAQTFLLITTDKLNKTDSNAVWVKSIAKSGLVINLSDETAPEIIRHLLKSKNISISDKALGLLLELNHGNANQLVQEANKLALLFPSGHQISHDDITSDSRDNSIYNIYQLSSSYLSGSLKQCITILNKVYNVYYIKK